MQLDSSGGDLEKLDDVQAEQHHAALKKIEKEQLKRLTSGRVFAPAGWQSGNVYSATYRMFDSAKLPANFFANGSWSIELTESFVANQGLLTRDGTRLEIPVEMMQLSKFGTRAIRGGRANDLTHEGMLRGAIRLGRTAAHLQSRLKNLKSNI